MRISTAMGSFKLKRYPLRQRDSLQAWDAGDEYLLHTVAGEELAQGATAKQRILVINDQFGALAIAFHGRDITSWGDSVVAHRGTEDNFKRNGFETMPQCTPATDSLSGMFDLVLIKIPKTLSLLEHQLAGLAGHIDANSTVFAAGMVKTVHNSTLALFEQYLGVTKTSLARKKARMILPSLDKVLAGDTQASPYPSHYHWQPPGVELYNHANVFSREQLDIGARAMLAVMDQLPPSRTIFDLGCGNGILGIAAKIAQPQAKLGFVDDSYMAVASARINWPAALGAAGLEAESAEFFTNDCLDGLEPAQLDLVICNPPFHEGQAIGDHIAWRMFKQSYDRLQAGGQLWVVGNKHLQYHAKLKRLFGNSRQLHSDKKFVVHAATKQT